MRCSAATSAAMVWRRAARPAAWRATCAAQHARPQNLPASRPPRTRITSFPQPVQCSSLGRLGVRLLPLRSLRAAAWHAVLQYRRAALLGWPVVLLTLGVIASPHWTHVQVESAPATSPSLQGCGVRVGLLLTQRPARLFCAPSIAETTVFRSRFGRVVRVAQRLPVAPAPEQHFIAAVRDHMVHVGRGGRPACGMALDAQRVLGEKRRACLAPPGAV